ncbi:MAG: patatin-like phospholipase family protein [Gemmatimonadales bacterium]
MTGERVVVVLGGGGAKCAAHLGAARALAEAGIKPIQWIGTSLGSVLAAALAAGESPDEILARFLSVRRNDVLVPVRFAAVRGLWNRGLLQSSALHRTVANLLSARSFASLQTPCSVTAVDADSGAEVVFGAGGRDAPLLDALAASYALPPYFPPYPLAGRRYYDGGLRGVVPLTVAAKVPCDRVIAVDVGPGFDETGAAVQLPPPLIQATDAAQGWLMAGTTELLRERWQLVGNLPPLTWVRPVSDRGATFAMERASAWAEQGYAAMEQALGDIRVTARSMT